MPKKTFPRVILFLNDNPMPLIFTKGTVSGKELRLRSAIKQVEAIHVVAPKGEWVGDKNNTEVGELEKKIIIHHIPPWPYYLRAIPLFLWGYYWAKKSNADLIEAESPIISGPASVILGKVMNIPSVVEVRATYSELAKIKLQWLPSAFKKFALHVVYKFTLSIATTIIANSTYYRNILSSQGYYSHTINPGLLLKRNVIRKKQLNQKKITIGYLGRIEEEKGLKLLLHAFGELLANKYNGIDVYLLVAGEGSMKKEAQGLVKNHKLLNKRVLFVGFQPTHIFLNKIDILVNPTTVIAPLEMVNVEAAEQFIPVICFGSCNIPETVVPNKTAIVVKNIESKNLLYAMQECIVKRFTVDPIAQKKLMHDFSFENQVKKLKKLYHYL